MLRLVSELPSSHSGLVSRVALGPAPRASISPTGPHTQPRAHFIIRLVYRIRRLPRATLALVDNAAPTVACGRDGVPFSLTLLYGP